MSNEETQKYINICVNQMKQSLEEWDVSLSGTGDTLVIAIKDDDGITCYVAKNYYESTEFYDYVDNF